MAMSVPPNSLVLQEDVNVNILTKAIGKR